MNGFMDREFLLDTQTAQKLFHEYAENMPICDYHCHLSPKEIYENEQPADISQLWLSGDHYKWRACAVAALMKSIARATHRQKKNLLNLPKHCNIA